MSNNDEIDKLFSSELEDYQIPFTEEEWAKMKSDMKRVNFRRFRFNTFNIYYVIGIIGVVMLSVVLFFVSQSSHREKETTRDSVSVSSPTPANTTVSYKDTVYKKAEPSAHPSNGKKEKPSTEVSAVSKPDSTVQHRNNSDKDTLNTRLNEPKKEDIQQTTNPVTIQPRIKKVKRTKVVKSDAVVVRDTVDVMQKQK